MARGKAGKTTIRDVAEMCGVSVQTVSRVINKRPDVSPATRAEVERVIAEVGYEPNVMAQGLVRQRTMTLGFVTSGLEYVGVSETLNGIAAECERSGYGLLLKTVPATDQDAIEEAFKFFIRRGAEGVIALLPHLGVSHIAANRLPAQTPPLCFLRGGPNSDFISINADNRSGAQMATAHLLATGRANIAHIAGQKGWVESEHRCEGWREALTEAGITPPPAALLHGDWSSRSGAQTFAQLLTDYPQMDAVFAANDQMALGVLSVCRERSIRVPEDIAVVGFDNVAEAAHFSPPLTTIAQPLMEMGVIAVRELLDQEAPTSTGPTQRVLPVELICRASSAPA